MSVPTDAEIAAEMAAACVRPLPVPVPLEWATLTQQQLEFRVHVDEAAARAYSLQVAEQAPWLMRRVEPDLWQPVAVLTGDGRWAVGDELALYLADQFVDAVPS